MNSPGKPGVCPALSPAQHSKQCHTQMVAQSPLIRTLTEATCSTHSAPGQVLFHIYLLPPPPGHNPPVRGQGVRSPAKASLRPSLPAPTKRCFLPLPSSKETQKACGIDSNPDKLGLCHHSKACFPGQAAFQDSVSPSTAGALMELLKTQSRHELCYHLSACLN